MQVSIFNDVVGPVMRGPSSSHCAAALRIGRLTRDLMDGEISEILAEFDVHGALPTTHESQGSDMGLFGGLMGWDADDERLPNSSKIIQDSGTTIHIKTVDVKDPHPNTYRLTVSNTEEKHTLIAISTGGGMIEVIEIDGFKLSIGGDYYVTLIYTDSPTEETIQGLRDSCQTDEILIHSQGEKNLVEIRASKFITDKELESLKLTEQIQQVKRLSPTLPVASRKGIQLPFTTCEEMLAYDAGKNRPLWELAIDYEKERGNLSREKVFDKMLNIVTIVRRSIAQGIQGTKYEDRILGHQCGRFKDGIESGALLDGGILNRMVLYVTALMEVKSSMGVIVAAPTAGACAGFPGGTLGAVDTLGLTDEDAAKAMLAGGLIGLFIATRSTFAAEVSGCQAEGGSASGMAAAALVTLGGGTLEQTIAAASMALQNCIGLTCDPVANRVEVPCLGRNVIAISNALSCANMAIADFDPVIPLDEVISTMDEVGRSLPRELRCTGLGGLSVTKTSKAIEQSLCQGCNC
ncbi:MAG TPA: serine dehydratase [Verrucomicrobiales bacterium]|nr:serine dehydratase [Verrucomicrobiales bacterium]HIL72279.1 serine dehydratase [Verrucomicrobiota bacterium]